jgi:hypothetical protein
MFRTVRSLRLLRQLLVAAVALAFSASVLEAVAPDVHDGDAVAVMVGHHDGGGSTNDQHRLPHDTPHGIHVEHCGHAHLASLSSGPHLELPHVKPTHAPVIPVARLESVATSPDFRPPIALS